MNVVNEKNAAEVARAVKDGSFVGPASVRRSPSFAELAKAMNKVQAEIEDPSKSKTADAGRRGTYRYADLPGVLDVVRPEMAKNGLAVVQCPCEYDDAPALLTLLLHTSGEWLETTIKLRPVQFDPQAVGSALTYARRYALLSMFGIAAEDDDGHAASHPHRQQAQPARPEVQKHSLRDGFAAWFAEAQSRERVATLTADVGRAKKAGDLTQEDCDFLRPLAEAALARFPVPVKA